MRLYVYTRTNSVVGVLLRSPLAKCTYKHNSIFYSVLSDTHIIGVIILLCIRKLHFAVSTQLIELRGPRKKIGNRKYEKK